MLTSSGKSESAPLDDLAAAENSFAAGWESLGGEQGLPANAVRRYRQQAAPGDPPTHERDSSKTWL